MHVSGEEHSTESCISKRCGLLNGPTKSGGDEVWSLKLGGLRLSRRCVGYTDHLLVGLEVREIMHACVCGRGG